MIIMELDPLLYADMVMQQEFNTLSVETKDDLRTLLVHLQNGNHEESLDFIEAKFVEVCIKTYNFVGLLMLQQCRATN